MVTNVAQMLYKSTVGGTPTTTSRSLGDRAGDIVNVKDYGATGDGLTNDTTAIQAALNAAFGTSVSPHGQSSELNKAVYFPAGIYIVSGNPALRVTGVRGGLILGAGMYSSMIRGTTAGGVTFLLNGFGFSTMRDLAVQCSGSGAVVALDYDWDGVAPQGSQNSLFQNCVFSGGVGSKNASAIGARLGHSNLQTDTSTFLNCSIGNANYGITTQGANCIGNNVIGTQFQSNNVGIYVPVGAIETIHGCFFAVNTTYDISVTGGAYNGYSISGCRSESANFLQAFCADNAVFHVEGIDHAAPPTTGLGHFLNANAVVHVDGCWSHYGDVTGSATNLTISDSIFDRFDVINLAANAFLTSTIFINNSYIGGVLSGYGRYILRQKIVRSVVRTFDVEATATTDLQVLYDSYNGAVAQNNFINTLPVSAGTSAAFSVASPTVVTMGQPHNFQGGEPVAFSLVGAGSLPTGITSARTYFVTLDSLVNGVSSQTTFHLNDTQAHALANDLASRINVSGAGSGAINTWAVRLWAVGDTILKTNAAPGGNPGWICTTAGWGATVGAGETQAVFTAFPNI